jgi:hypothetical protein
MSDPIHTNNRILGRAAFPCWQLQGRPRNTPLPGAQCAKRRSKAHISWRRGCVVARTSFYTTNFILSANRTSCIPSRGAHQLLCEAGDLGTQRRIVLLGLHGRAQLRSQALVLLPQLAHDLVGRPGSGGVPRRSASARRGIGRVSCGQSRSCFLGSGASTRSRCDIYP